ncbi:reverse transcriptase domain-containing protein [Tanacetum coccineum]
MDKIRRDKRKEVHARLDFGESPKKRRIREGSQNSSARTLSARYRNPSERLKVRDRLRYNDRHVLDRLGIVLTVEVALTEIVLGAETAPAASKNHMIIPAPPTGRGPNMDIALATETAPVMNKSTDEDDLAVPWICEEVDPFTPQIRNFKSSRKTRMPNNVKTYDGTGDPEDHVKNFQATAQVERWAMPTWCHMFNSTLIGVVRVWFDELPPDSIDGYKDLKAAFLAYFMQQKKYVKDPVEIHNIKQRGGATIKEFMERFKVETGRMKGASKCMRISGFMHGVNNPELTKRLSEHVPKTMKEMMIATTAFIRGEAAAAGKNKGHASWRAQDPLKRHASEQRSDFRGQPREGRGSSRMTRQKVTQSFERVSEIMFPSLTTSSGTEGPLVIEAKISGYMIHRIYVDEVSSTEVFYEHCFNRLRPKIKNKMVPATTSLTGFSRETIWPLGQLRVLVTIGDAVYSTKAWMNFMIVRSLSPYNGIIRRP